MTIAFPYPRDGVLARLAADIVGPHDSAETLDARPSDVYASGILWPQNLAPDPADDDRLGVEGDADADEGTPADETEAVAVSSLRRPSAAGLSFAVSSAEDDPTVSAIVDFALYSAEEPADGKGQKVWRRRSIQIRIDRLPIPVGTRTVSLEEFGAPGKVELHVRALPLKVGRLVTLTLVNGVQPELDRDAIEEATLFQTGIKVFAVGGTQLIPRPSRRAGLDADDAASALLYRGAIEFAAGHTCSAEWLEDGEGHATSVSTTWLPTAIVPAVNPNGHDVFSELASKSPVFQAAWLADARPAELSGALVDFVRAYRDWIATQESKLLELAGPLKATGEENLRACRDVASRMQEAAILIGSEPILTRAFQLANRAMVLQYSWDRARAAQGQLRWRPFQLGFLLLASQSSVDATHPARDVMDVLWFPTGGGKTEAYLGLVALTVFYRRLSSPVADDGAGVAAVMRYTLRLLTTQQFGRAAALMLACELIRRGSKELGSVPFSIGLWVGGDASPNKRKEAYANLRGQGGASPKQLANCPACGELLHWTQVDNEAPVLVRCRTGGCVLSSDSEPLPVWTVDEDIYVMRPTLLIGTVDKFAQIVRKPEINGLFGLDGRRVPDLIIQDELHLISGPLGTVAGLYEAAFDLLLTASGAKPKVIGSTATIRRAADQVRALFDRTTCQFPPPAINHDDSGFAVRNDDAPGRLYVGVASAGRSAKYTLQAVAASLLQSGAAGFDSVEEANHYWTLVTYFNSLRELGGSLVLMQDDVHDSLVTLSALRSESPRVPANIEELTSRRSQEDIRNMLDWLAIPAGKASALDVVLATNMLSVGVDIPRLGLMLVYGQPKGIAEYIQATSRVGRGSVAGLVVSVLNSAKARDRSHFETFRTWHSTLYRDVEATSVTPFASRARDRALHAVLVAAVRHLAPGMLAVPGFDSVSEAAARKLVEAIAQRAERIDPDETAVRGELTERLDEWIARVPANYWLEYKPRESLLQSAERAATEKALGRSPGDAWPTMNNMRSVEPGTPFRLAERLRANGGQGNEE